MFHALVRGKHRNEEDCLTSSVFGMLQHVPEEVGLFQFLAQARTTDDTFPLSDLSGHVTYRLWPRWPNCEPDVELLVENDAGRSILVGVEAKYRSGKSSEADDAEEQDEEQLAQECQDCTDQLVREWLDLCGKAREVNAEGVLVYLTADVSIPIEQIQDSLDEYRRKRPGSPDPVICWLSWRELSKLFENDSTNGILAALAKMAKDLGLTYFQGFKRVVPIHFGWSFMRAAPSWRFQVPPINFQWSFKP